MVRTTGCYPVNLGSNPSGGLKLYHNFSKYDIEYIQQKHKTLMVKAIRLQIVWTPFK